MNIKTLSNHSLSVIEQYLHFIVGNAVCSVPYFNNKTIRARAALRANIGKGSPNDILEEVETIIIKNRIDPKNLDGQTLKKILTDNNIGVECSGFAYYILNAENEERGNGSLDKHISFVNCSGVIGKIRCSLRPVENCDVSTFAADKNSRPITIREVQPGDMITMTSLNDKNIYTINPENNPLNERDHILIIHQVEYQNFIPTKIHYSHAVAYPEDGIYGTGIRQGGIEVMNPDGSITEAAWTEEGRTNNDNRLFVRAQNSKTEIRRLKWF